jgi:hypothetical protein
MRTIPNPMAGLSPPTVDTLAALVRIRAVQYLRAAICSLREPAEPERVARFLGVAEGQINVLYDLNAPCAWAMLTHLRRVAEIAYRTPREVP